MTKPITERPIVFSGSEVNLILEGKKTQARRVITPAPVFDYLAEANGNRYGCMKGSGAGTGWVIYGDNPARIVEQLKAGAVDCPFGKAGDRLWVRETWSLNDPEFDHQERPEGRPLHQGRWPFYEATDDAEGPDGKSVWRSSTSMPRWASRLLLEIVSIRVDRAQDISGEDALAEGVEANAQRRACGIPFYRARKNDWMIDAWSAFGALWNIENGKKHPWSANPWVWCVAFKKIEAGQ